MASNFPFAVDSLKSIKIYKKNGKGINIVPWILNSLSPLISLTIDESIYNPLMSGTMVIEDVGDWSNEMHLNAFDEIEIILNIKKRANELSGANDGSVIESTTLSFEVTNVKNSVDIANQSYQNSLEKTKAVTIEFISKNVMARELLSSLLEDDNFIGPIISKNGDEFDLTGTQPTTVKMKGFDTYLKQKLKIDIDGDRTWNYCYLKKNNMSYPWGKLRGQPTILQTMQYLAENAVEYNNNTAVNYLFWQDMDGFHFRSINSLMEQNLPSAGDYNFQFTDVDLYSNKIRSFMTLSEFDALNLINSDAYFSWYERIIPDYADPYLDFVDSTDSLIRKKIYYDINKEYTYTKHIESGKLFQDGITAGIDGKYSIFAESKRKDDDIYGFFSKNRYNTPHPQEWDYLGITSDTRLSNVVWQNQYDLDDEVYPEFLYAYDKLIKKNLIKNREKYVQLKNAKRKWEVYRCSVCCTTEQGGTADRDIISKLNESSNSADYVYYFGATGIFGNLISDGYGVVAAGAFSDVVNYMPGASGVSGNGLTLSYDMNAYPYNQTIGEFYHLKSNLQDITDQIDRTITDYQNDLGKINPYISKIEVDFLPFVDQWILAATDLAYSNLTPGFKNTCSSWETNPNGPYGPGTGNICCNDLNAAYGPNCRYYGIVDSYPREGTLLQYHKAQYGANSYRFDFGIAQCNVQKLPLYVNLQFDKTDTSSYPPTFSGYWNKLIQYNTKGDEYYPYYITPIVTIIDSMTGCPNLVNGPMSYELNFQKPAFLYQCSRTKLLTGKYYRTFQDPNFINNDYNEILVNAESDWLDNTLLDGVNNETIWCATCLDPISLQAAKFEYTKILKQLKTRKFVIDNLIAKLQNIKNTFTSRYQEFLNRKAFFISKNPFDKEEYGNIFNKNSPLNLLNVKSIKRKPIRGSKYEVLAKRMGLSGGSTYAHSIFFNDDDKRNPGITGNHPYYDQKYKSFLPGISGFSINYATKPGFDVEKRDYTDAYYYDNRVVEIVGMPGLISTSVPGNNTASLILPSGIFSANKLKYETTSTLDVNGSISANLPANTTLQTITNKYNIFDETASKKPPSLVKEEISSYVRIEFINPIGLDKLADFPTGFIRDAGSEYFLPYLVQLTSGPNGRQTIQNNVAVIGVDPYGFDVAVKKIRTKNSYSDYKEWGNYWWHTPVNKMRIQNKTRDIPEMSLWSEKQFENEFTYYENNGTYVHDIGEDYTEYDNYVGSAGGIMNNLGVGYVSRSFYPSYRTSYYYHQLNTALDNIISPTSYSLPVKDETAFPSIYGQNMKITKQSPTKSIHNSKYGSYNLIGSHLHYNIRRSWYDFSFPSKLYFNTLFNNIANLNNETSLTGFEYPIFNTDTMLKANDFVAFGGNDFANALDNSISLKDSTPLQTFLQANSIDNLIFNNLDVTSDQLLSQFSGISSNAQSTIDKIFTDDIEFYLNSDFTVYKPGLLSKQVWKYDIFGETEYGMTSPPTLPPEYDIFDNNFSAQFVVFSRTNSESNICKKLNLKCLNPNGAVSNSECPASDPYCNCPAKNIIPKEREPSYKELAIAFEETKECNLIEKYLGNDFLGCILSDDTNVASCNCPNQGKYFPTFLNTIRSNATFYVTPPETPLRRQAQMMLFNGQRATMTIYPNDELKIGTIININKPNPTRDYINRYDRISGKWMVTGISRIFKSTNVESMIVSLNRDSYFQENNNPSNPTTYKKDIY